MSCDWLPQSCNLFPSIVQGDTTPEALRITIDDAAGTLASVEVIFNPLDSEASALELKSEDDEITLTTTTEGAWDFLILPFEASPPAGDYKFQLRTTNTDGANRTWIEGDFTIAPKI